MKRKVLIAIGTRPEAIKLAPVVTAFNQSDDFKTYVLSTGQHRELLQQVLTVFGLKVDKDLKVMQSNQSLSQLSATLMGEMDKVFSEVKPDIVLVQGDTTTAFIAALIAFYHKIKVAHVEAGLRSFNNHHPFPEEVNRRFISVIADWHFAPTELACQNLIREQIPKENIYRVGNTSVDALQHMLQKKEENSQWSAILQRQKIILVTAHRRENFGAPFEEICRAILQIAKNFPEVLIVFPMHLNPNVQKQSRQFLSDVDNILLLEPLDYLDFIQVMQRADIVITDSGGVQEEAPILGKPVLVLRQCSERMEGILAGVAKLVGHDRELIVNEVTKLLEEESYYQSMSNREISKDLYGDGNAAARIVDIIHASQLLTV